MLPALMRERFGRERLGSILGMSLGIALIGAFVGPPLAGWVFDNFGSYQSVWFACSGIALVGMVSLLTMPSASYTIRMATKPGDQKNTS